MPMESEFQTAAFTYRKTLVTRDGEVDFFRSEDIPSTEIRVTMVLSADGSGLCYQSADVVGVNGKPMQILSEDGVPLGGEVVERMAMEHIVADGCREMDYAYGREQCGHSIGEYTLSPGEAFRPDSYSQEPAM